MKFKSKNVLLTSVTCTGVVANAILMHQATVKAELIRTQCMNEGVTDPNEYRRRVWPVFAPAFASICGTLGTTIANCSITLRQIGIMGGAIATGIKLLDIYKDRQKELVEEYDADPDFWDLDDDLAMTEEEYLAWLDSRIEMGLDDDEEFKIDDIFIDDDLDMDDEFDVLKFFDCR